MRKYFKLFGLRCPLAANPRIPATRSLPVVLSQNEISEFLKSCTDLRDKTLLGILYDTGMRKSEVLHLELSDLDFDRNAVHIREGKGRKDRYVPFSKNMQKVVLAYLRAYHPHQYLFDHKEGHPKVMPDTQKKTD